MLPVYIDLHLANLYNNKTSHTRVFDLLTKFFIGCLLEAGGLQAS